MWLLGPERNEHEEGGPASYGLGSDYQLAPGWIWSAGFSHASSPVRGKNRSVALPFDSQLRIGTGVRYDWSQDLTLALSYEYLDLGNNRVNQTLADTSGTLVGDFGPSRVQFIAFTLRKRF